MRLMWSGRLINGGITPITTKESGVKSPSDLKGKRIPYVPGQEGTNCPIFATLRFANLSHDDVKLVQFSSYGAAAKGMIAGKSVLVYGSCTNTWNYELEASPRGIVYLDMDPNDKEGWARFHEVAPFISPANLTGGAGMDPNKRYNVAEYPYPVMAVYERQDERFVYHFAKLIDETYDRYKGVSKFMPGMHHKHAVRPPVILPFHRGSIKYFKEKGYWTRECQAAQEKLLKQEALLLKAWEEFTVVADKKNIKGKAFAEQWEKKRAEVLGIRYISYQY